MCVCVCVCVDGGNDDVCVCVCVCVDELHGCVSVGIGVYFLVRRYVRGIFVALTLRIRINVFA